MFYNIFKEIKILLDYRDLPHLFDSKTFPKKIKIKTYQDSRSHQDCLEYKTWISASFNLKVIVSKNNNNNYFQGLK